MCRRILLILCLLSISIWHSSPASAEITVSADIQPATLHVGENGTLTVLVTGSSRSAKITLPEIDQVRWQRRGQSHQMSLVNGSFSSSLATNYAVSSQTPGQYTIPPIEVRVEGETHRTEPIHFTVIETTGQPVTGDNASNDEIAFLSVSGFNDHYSGELVPVTIKAYFSRDLRFDIKSLPRLEADGVVMDQLESRPRRSEEVIGDQTFNVLSWETNLTGIKTGSHQLRFVLEAIRLIPTKRNPGSLFGDSRLFGDAFMDDPFFDNLFGGYRKQPVSLQTPPLEFLVRALPEEGQPADFSGAIGQFRMAVTAEPKKIAVGEPITVKMEISGQGNFNRVSAPSFPDSPAWKLYTPAGKAAENGIKIFEQAVIPQEANITAIPPLRFSYFDPRERKYKTLHSDPVSIEVRTAESAMPSAHQQLQSEARPQPQPEQAQNRPYGGLAPPHLTPGSPVPTIRPMFLSWWYVGIVSCCLVVLLTLTGLAIWRQKSNRNRELTVRKQRQKDLETDLATLHTLTQSSDQALFLRQCRATIRRQLGYIWGLHPEAIALTDLQERLPAESPLIAIFQTADEAAYGGGRIEAGQKEKFAHTIRTELLKTL